MKQIIMIISVLVIMLLAGCSEDAGIYVPADVVVDRHDSIPADAVKMSPDSDINPPELHSDEFEEPVPFSAVNTAGAEDSPFVPADRNEFYFFFTPDVAVQPQEQVQDGVTGIYVSRYEDGAWQDAERVMLQDPGRLALDGCAFVEGEEIYFCTAREGYTGLHWFTAERMDGSWSGWEEAFFPEEYFVGELHFTDNGETVYYHSPIIEGSKGEIDIWMSQKEGGEWQTPVNIDAVNTEVSEGWPYISPNGKELWFNRWHKGTPAVFRSKLVDGSWQEPELMVSTFAGEPTLDRQGNLYFVHHYFEDGNMIEADIYVAHRK